MGRRRKVHTSCFGTDVALLLHVFGHRPELSQAFDAVERAKWLREARELLFCYIGTLPLSDDLDDEVEWDGTIGHYGTDILAILANRLLECSKDEQAELWLPIMSLPPPAHEHVADFLRELLIATNQNTDRVKRLVPLWLRTASHLLASDSWRSS